MKYECTICHHIYDENIEGTKWKDLLEDRACHYVELVLIIFDFWFKIA